MQKKSNIIKKPARITLPKLEILPKTDRIVKIPKHTSRNVALLRNDCSIPSAWVDEAPRHLNGTAWKINDQTGVFIGGKTPVTAGGFVVVYETNRTVGPLGIPNGILASAKGPHKTDALKKTLFECGMTFSLSQAVYILANNPIYDGCLSLKRWNEIYVHDEKCDVYSLVVHWKSGLKEWHGHIRRFGIGRGPDQGYRVIVRDRR